jgi:hypothetical protein
MVEIPVYRRLGRRSKGKAEIMEVLFTHVSQVDTGCNMDDPSMLTAHEAPS